MTASSSRRVALLAYSAAALSLLPLGGGEAARAAGCVVDTIRDRWSDVTRGRNDIQKVVGVNGDVCALVATDRGDAVLRSTDAGVSWRRAAPVGFSVENVVSEHLAPGQVLAASADAAVGMALSEDGGLTFRTVRIVSPSAVALLDAVTVPGDRRHIYVLVSSAVPRGPSVYESTDGETFLPLAGSAGLVADAIRLDPLDARKIWLGVVQGVGVAVGGVYQSADGGVTFLSTSLATIVTDLSVTASRAGAVDAVAASAFGLQRSVDGGTSWYDAAPTTYLFARHEGGEPLILQAVLNGTPVRSRDGGVTSAPNIAGLPSGCRLGRLQALGVAPTVYLASCVDQDGRSDGRWARYRASQASLVGERPAGGVRNPPAVSPGEAVASGTPLAVLDTFVDPSPDGGGSGTVTFDGRLLYFTGFRGTKVHRLDPVTRRLLPDLDLGVETHYLTFDTRRNLLYVLTPLGGSVSEGYELSTLYAYDFSTRQLRKMFTLPPSAVYYKISYDSFIDGFRLLVDSQLTIATLDYRGRFLDRCRPALPPAARAVAEGRTDFRGFAAVLGAGDGGMYVQFEDDSTLVRLDEACNTIRVYAHRRYAEATAENDSLACDTLTFRQPAVWIRDAQVLGTFTAYAVPNGYCPLPTTLALAAPRVVHEEGTAPVCARLSRRIDGGPLAGEPVSINVDNVVLAEGRTDARGRLCATYQPARLRALPGAAAAARLGVHGLSASFPGSRDHLPSRARGAIEVVNAETPAQRPRTGLPPVPPQPPAPARLPQIQPQPNLQQAPAPQPQPQPQTQPQPHAQQQPNANPAAVPQEDAQQQVAGVTVQSEAAQGDLAMVRGASRRRGAPGTAGAFLLVAGLLTVAQVVMARGLVRAPSDSTPTRRVRYRW